MNGIPPSFLFFSLFSFLFPFFFFLESTGSKGAYLVGLDAWTCNKGLISADLWTAVEMHGNTSEVGISGISGRSDMEVM